MLGISWKNNCLVLIQRYHQHNQVNKATDSFKSVEIQFSFLNSRKIKNTVTFEKNFHSKFN